MGLSKSAKFVKLERFIPGILRFDMYMYVTSGNLFFGGGGVVFNCMSS